MTASAAMQIGLYVGLVPMIAAVVAYYAIQSALPDGVGRRYAAGGAMALGVLVGYVLLPSTETLAPLQFYEWIAYLGLGAAIIAGLMIADSVWRGERVVATMFAAMLAAWFVVPTWPDQLPPQHFHVVGMGLSVFLLARLLEFLPARLSGRAFPLWLFCGAGAVALLMMAEVGQTLGRLAALPAGALAGCTFAIWMSRRECDLRSLALPYAVIVGANAFTGYVYPTPPLRLLLLVPFAPLALWLCAVGPGKRLSGAAAIVVQGACLIVPLAILVAIVLVRGSAGGESW